MNTINPSDNLFTAPTAPLSKPIKAKKTGIFKLPNNAPSKIFIGRETEKSKKQSVENSFDGKLDLDPRGKASRKHAEISFNPLMGKLVIKDIASSYGSYVEQKDASGELERTFIIDLSDSDPDAAKHKRMIFLEGAGELISESEQAQIVDSLELDLAKPWTIHFGAALYHQFAIDDQLVNDGNEIYYIRETPRSHLDGKPEKNYLILRHNTLKREDVDEGFAQRTKSAFGAVLARIGLKKKD